MKTSHELPLCFLNKSYEWNDYEFCLPTYWFKSETYKKALQYLLDRKVDMNFIEKYNLGYIEKGSKKYINRIVFPSYDSNDKLNYRPINENPVLVPPFKPIARKY